MNPYEQFSEALCAAGADLLWMVPRPYPRAPFSLECWACARGIVIAQIWKASPAGGSEGRFHLFEISGAPNTITDCIKWAMTAPPPPTPEGATPCSPATKSPS